MTSLVWKLNRLRAMSGLEMLHRGYRWGSHKIEKRIIALGWQPRPVRPVGHRLSLFPDMDDWRNEWGKYYSLDVDALNRLILGNINLFSHDFLYVGAPVEWQRDPLTGRQSPLVYGKTLDYRDDKQVGDIKVLWELNRQQHLISLAVAYAYSGNTVYLKEIISQIEGWITANPFGMGVHWCSSLEVALRLVSWSVVHSLIMLCGHEQGLFSVIRNNNRFGESIYQQAWFIRHYLSRHSSANNHLIGELTGLWAATQVFDLGATGERWSKFAKQELEQQAQLQVYADGVGKEQAIYYHLWVLEYLLFSWLVGERSGNVFSDEFKKRILAMSDFLRDIIPAGGRLPPQIGDADDGFVTRFELNWPKVPYDEILAAVSYAFKSAKVHPGLSIPPQKAFWYAMVLGNFPNPAGGQATRNIIKKYPILYRHGGYAVLANGPSHLVFDAGPLGYPSIAAHAHADALNFCLALDGEWWLIDPGTYAYHGESVWREYFRGTSAHNTLVADGLNQSLTGGPFLWLQHADARLESLPVAFDGTQRIKGWHDGYRKVGLRHQREIQLSQNGNDIKVIDDVAGKGSHHLTLHFHFAPDVELTYDNLKDCWTARKEGSNRVLSIKADSGWKWEIIKGCSDPILGWYSDVLGEKKLSPTMRGLWHGEIPHRTETSFHIDNLEKL